VKVICLSIPLVSGNHPSKADVITNVEIAIMGHRSHSSGSESDGQRSVKA